MRAKSVNDQVVDDEDGPPEVKRLNYKSLHAELNGETIAELLNVEVVYKKNPGVHPSAVRAAEVSEKNRRLELAWTALNATHRVSRWIYVTGLTVTEVKQMWAHGMIYPLEPTKHGYWDRGFEWDDAIMALGEDTIERRDAARRVLGAINSLMWDEETRGAFG